MHIHGPLHGTELAALFQSATVYVQPTIYNEGLPLPVLEAQACGAPCVVTRSGGMPEVVEEGVTGYVVPAGDPAAIAARVSSLLGDSETRARMGDLASRRAHARFTWKHIAEEMHDVVSTIAHDGPRSRVRGESGKATSAGNG
jgi:starch synthase